jgi:spore coat polysaccharide biosynthesis protein SpsF (cytidylyltransferase family)
VVVTSINKENLPLIRLCAEHGVRVFAGSENDVLDRFYQCAKLLNPEYIVRVTADCPFYDASILDAAIQALDPKSDYLADFDETLADGLDIEIMKFAALEDAWRNADMQSEREHVTLYIRNNKDNSFAIQNFRSPVDDLSRRRWTIDEHEDYVFAEKIYTHFIKKGNEFFDASAILDYIREHPQVEKINRDFVRNTGLLKSLREDKKVK